MLDKKLTDNEIVKALECCSEANNCGQCEYEPTEHQIGSIGCSNELMKDALDLINRLQAENEELRQVAEHQQKISMDRYFEIERLLQKLQQAQKEKNKLMDAQMLLAKTSDEQQAEIERLKEEKSTTIKEFEKRLLACYEGFDKINEVILFENLVKAIEDTKREMEASENGN